MGPELQIFCESSCSDLALYGAAGVEGRPAPFGAAFWIGIDPACYDAAACFFCLCELVIAISFDRLAGFGVDLSFIIIGQLFPAASAAVGRVGAVGRLKG